MIDEVFETMRDSIAKSNEALRQRLGRIRTGRANAALLDSVRVDYYGTMTPLNQMATINTPEPRLLMVKPFDRSVVAAVEKAIQAGDLGLNPSSDGEIIRIPIPPLNEERRQEFVKMARKLGEEGKVAVRGARRDCNDLLKDLESGGDAPKDDVARALKKIQTMTDDAVADVDKIVDAKEKRDHRDLTPTGSIFRLYPLVVVVLTAALSSCGGGAEEAPASTLPRVSESDVGVHQSKVQADADRPMLVEWPATEKAALQASAKEGIVVVHYDGRRLKMLDQCRVSGECAFHETSRSRDGFDINSHNDLFARLPLGAASLKGELSEGKRLSLSYVAVGVRKASVPYVDHKIMTGDCAQATHFVSTMIVGAYELSLESSLEIGAAVEVGPAGTGGGHGNSAQVIRSDGNLVACMDHSTPAESPACGAVVQLVLVGVTRMRPPPPPVAAAKKTVEIITRVVDWPSEPKPKSPPKEKAKKAPTPEPVPTPEPPVTKEPKHMGGTGDFELVYHEAYCLGSKQIVPFTNIDPLAKKALKMIRGRSFCSLTGPFLRLFENHAVAIKWVEDQSASFEDDEDDEDW